MARASIGSGTRSSLGKVAGCGQRSANDGCNRRPHRAVHATEDARGKSGARRNSNERLDRIPRAVDPGILSAKNSTTNIKPEAKEPMMLENREPARKVNPPGVPQ